ncbi:MAG TPA: prolyl oligopeptidase family serine peptidase [Candidatus Acidoferrales bacterium]|nr:prolyl oligopeptidase family serine peptidase [Candidatus Acidoferrales bacterium]
MTRKIVVLLPFFAALALFALISAADAPGSFSLEQVMSAPFPGDLVAAPAGAKFAWIQNARGLRNIWVAEPAAPGQASATSGYAAHQVTHYSADDGIDIGELRWTPDAQSLLYTRGADLEGGDSDPNPRSNPAGPEHAIWMVAASGGEPRKLAEGRGTAVSPRGDVAAYLKEGQVWSAPLDGKEKPAQLIHAHGQASALRWSPDGARLAFVSGRKDHGYIGVYTLADKSLRFLDPSVDRDSNPVWSPDGARIAFVRIAASSLAFAFGPRREGQPWSIHVAEVTTGQGREVWRAREGRGSVFHQIVAENQLFWAAGDRIIFPWEGDGWLHLYSVPAAGGAADLLTPGGFEVEHVSLTPGGREVIYSSNQDDIDRRHIWRARFDGGKPAAVTRGTGIEWSPVVSSDGKTIVVLHSDARRPARAALLTAAGEARDLAPDSMPADFPAGALVEPQQVIFSASDGLAIHGQLFLPAGLKPGERRPALLFFHGGSRREMLLGWHYMGYYHNAYAMNQFLASRGYIVFSVNYRSGIGYGMEFREALNYGATGASEFNDVMGAGVYLRSRPDVDPQRIGLWGGSYGGYLTALGLARASDLFAAGVDFHGVHNWSAIRNFVPAYNPEANPDAARLAYESSPIASVKTWRSPVLLIQGDDDRNVPFSETVTMAEALRKQGVEVEQLIFPDEIHDFLLHESWLRAYHAAVEFFDRRLTPRSH